MSLAYRKGYEAGKNGPHLRGSEIGNYLEWPKNPYKKWWQFIPRNLWLTGWCDGTSDRIADNLDAHL